MKNERYGSIFCEFSFYTNFLESFRDIPYVDTCHINQQSLYTTIWYDDLMINQPYISSCNETFFFRYFTAGRRRIKNLYHERVLVKGPPT